MASSQPASLGHGRPLTLRNPSSSSSAGGGPPLSASGPSTPSSAAPRRPSSTPSRNPISLRLYKVLASNFDEPSSLEALKTVSDYYSAPPASGADGASASSSTAAAAAAGDPSTGSASRARKALRDDADERLAQGSRSFLDAFGDVDSKLEELRSHMNEMQARCDDVQSRLAVANQGTSYLLSRAEGLRAQQASTELRLTLIDLFLSRFTLPAAQLNLLASSSASTTAAITPEFFRSIDQLCAIRADCRSLLLGGGSSSLSAAAAAAAGGGGDTIGAGAEGTTQAGEAIMKHTARTLEGAYEKLARWAKAEVRGLSGRDGGGGGEVGPVLREAVGRLREERPDLLAEILGILTTLRSSALLSSFLEALTRGSSNSSTSALGGPRPIELHAHDPERYVGDMLAWIHQAVAGEREFLEGLFGLENDGRMVGSVRRNVGSLAQAAAAGDGAATPGDRKAFAKERKDREDCVEKERLVREVLDRCLEGCCRPLRIRIQHTIRSQDGVMAAYKIVNLLQFYLLTMRRTLGEDALLAKTLHEIWTVSYKTFFDTLDAVGRSLLRFLHPPDADLSPPQALLDSTVTLRAILSVYESTLMDSDGPQAEREREEEFSRILDAAVDPLLEMVRRMADLRVSRGARAEDGGMQWDKAVFLVNCIGYLEHVLETFSFTTARVASLHLMLDRYVKFVANAHYETCLGQSGLQPILQAIEERDADTPLSRIPAAAPPALSAALGQFHSYLQTLDVLSSPRLSLMTSTARAQAIHHGALVRLARAYDRVYDAVADKEGGRYEFPLSLLRRDRQEVRTLLGVGADELAQAPPLAATAAAPAPDPSSTPAAEPQP